MFAVSFSFSLLVLAVPVASASTSSGILPDELLPENSPPQRSTLESLFEDCDSQMSTLETALYETKDNIFELNKVFYPPSMRTSRFIRVTYIFLNRNGEDDGCNVTYIWAIGGFLFFQPPTLFQFNSLFFNYPNNDLTSVKLELPFPCRALIEADNKTTGCSCLRDSARLEILTQQVS